MAQVKQCPGCGKLLMADAELCTRCGESFVDGAASASIQTVSNRGGRELGTSA